MSVVRLSQLSQQQVENIIEGSSTEVTYLNGQLLQMKFSVGGMELHLKKIGYDQWQFCEEVDE